ncbi:hypothetical protein HUU59_11045 [bacterium]|nr:hypothetical protein [bacterium]
MKRTPGHRYICKDCAKKADKKDWGDYVQGKGKHKPPSAIKAANKAPKKVAKRIKPQAAFMAPMQASSELAAIVGTKPQPRTDVTKKVWDYIKKHGLQDKKNKRNINVDEALGKVFANKKGVVPKQVSMFEMTKLVTRHLTPVKQ